jgi:cytochrome c-type biogenesis protein CcmH/NrfG
MKCPPVVLVALCVLLACPLQAQQRDAAPGNQVTGRLIMEDGSPIPSSAAVELRCQGQVRRRVRAYANGDFSLLLGADSSETPDISVPADLVGGKVPFDTRPTGRATGGGDIGRFDSSGCDLRALLPGFQSNTIAIGPRRAMDNSDVGTLLLRRLVAPDGAVMLASTLAAPEKARKAYEHAWMYLQMEKPDYANAAKELAKAVEGYPAFAQAWNLMGRTRFAMADGGGARDAFRRSILADSKYAEPYVQLARIEMQSGDWAETIRWASQAQQLTPYDPDANYLSAFASFQLGDFDAAEQSALEVERSSALSRFPVAYYILASAEARHGEFEIAAARLRQFLQTNPDPDTAVSVRAILAEWSALDDKPRKAP